MRGSDALVSQYVDAQFLNAQDGSTSTQLLWCLEDWVTVNGPSKEGPQGRYMVDLNEVMLSKTKNK